MKWTKRPGGRANLCKVTNFGLYATAALPGTGSDKDQARIWISRRMVGSQGSRSYHYSFTASLYLGGKGIAIRLPDTAQSDPAKAMKAVSDMIGEAPINVAAWVDG